MPLMTIGVDMKNVDELRKIDKKVEAKVKGIYLTILTYEID